MKIQTVQRFHRQGWELSNDKLALVILAGGGHLAELRLAGGPAVNPFWIPGWRTIEPGAYRKQDAARYGIPLLASLAGHSLCLGAFGDPSAEEEAAGLGCHGEAPVARWRLLKKSLSARRLSVRLGCELPIARMSFTRTVTLEAGSSVVRLREEVISRARCDLPFTMCQHVSLGAPFVEPGVTVFDMPARQGHTFPGAFGRPQRLRHDRAFQWPQAPGANGKPVDLRFAGRSVYGDYTANRIDPRREQAWFSALNPKQGLLLAYVWRRSDYPWVGIWEENRSRKALPWNGKTVARGMEFSNAPFPEGLRGAVTRGTFQGEPTFRWLPALGRAVFEYALLALPAAADSRGVADIRPRGKAFDIDIVV